MRRSWLFIASLVFWGLSGFGLGQQAVAQEYRIGAPLFHGFLWGWDVPPETMRKLPAEVRRAVEERRSLRQSYQPRLLVPKSSRPTEREVAEKEQQLEMMLVSLSGAIGAATEAAQYARASQMSYEWEGDSAGPMREAATVERYLLEHPATILAPALSVFALHRFRCGYEAAAWARDLEVQKQAVHGYLAAWLRLQKSRDPLIRALAQEIDQEPYLYIEAEVHPRAFKAPVPLNILPPNIGLQPTAAGELVSAAAAEAWR